MIVKLAEAPLQTKFGAFTETLYYDGQKQIIALVMDDVTGKENVYCRVHSTCISGHFFNSVQCDCREQMEMAQRRIQAEGRGVIILMDQEGRGNGHLAIMQTHALKAQGMSQTEAYLKLGYSADARSYVQAAEILRDLGVRSVRLLTNNADKESQMRAEGLVIAGTERLEMENDPHKTKP